MARILANYYASVYSTDERRDHPSPPEPSTIMNAPRFTSAAVHKELSTFYTAKGSGPDDLHPFMLQILADLLAEYITALYNKSLQSGEIPQDWRKAIICPIFKKGDPEDAPNYRPVSLTSVLCKIFWLCFCFLQRHDPFHRVSMDSFLVDPAYPTLSFRKNVQPVCWMKDTRWT